MNDNLNFSPKKPFFGFWSKLFFFFMGLGIVGTGILAIMVIVTYPKLPSMSELRDYKPKLPLQVYSSDGVVLGQFGQEHRIYVSFKDTPKMLVDAILSAEDERFYQHGGVDFIGIIRAAFTNVVHGHIKSGASTITMQVARNFFLSSKRSYSRKFDEALLSYKIEKSLTKEQILELYINQIFLGQRSYGFAEAALTYFGKPLDKLSIAQYAVLAGLPKAPSAFNPVVNKKRSREREIYVLGRMKTLGFITEKQYKEAIAEKISVVQGSLKDVSDSGGYIAEMVRQILYEKFGEDIYTKGYKVYTTVNSKTQQQAYTALRSGLLNYDAQYPYRGAEAHLEIDKSDDNEGLTDQAIDTSFDDLIDVGDLRVAVVTSASNNEVSAKLRDGTTLKFSGKDLYYVSKNLSSGGDLKLTRGAVIRVRNVNGKWQITQIPQVEGALVAMNPKTGAIEALVGGFDFTRNNFNHATQAMRQPGSGFKPFVYSAALEKGFMPSSIIDDSPVCYSGGVGGGQWCPRNDEREFEGSITFRQALAKSINVVTVKILNRITPSYALNYFTKFGFAESQFQPYLSTALGAGEVTPLQMARGYSVFANGGYLVDPYVINTITDNSGNILAKTKPNDIQSQNPVIDPRNAFIMTSVLKDVVRYGTGARVYRTSKRDDLAGKTGTTTSATDVWFNGYTPNLTAVVWVGYEQPKSLGAHAYGATVSLPIWLDFMQNALNGVPQVIIPMPPGIKVIPNSTWKGNDEYVYENESRITNINDASTSDNQNASDTFKELKPQDASAILSKQESTSANGDDASDDGGNGQND